MSAVSYRRHDTPAGGANSPTVIDLLDICRARSLERRAPNLLSTIIEQILTRTRAQKGAIVLTYGGARSVVVQGIAGEHPTSELRSVYLEDDNDIPRTIIRHVLRTSAAVSLESAFQQRRFSRDPYLRRTRPQAIHCLPLLIASRLIGVLYLEDCHTQLAPSEHTDHMSDLGRLAASLALAIDAACGAAAQRARFANDAHDANDANDACSDEAPSRAIVTWDIVRHAAGYTHDHPSEARAPDTAFISAQETPASAILDATNLRATEQTLRASERFAGATLNALTEHICVLDEHGEIVATNAAWKAFASANGGSGARVDVGTNYLAVCDAVTGPEAADARDFAAGIRRVMRGEQDQCAVEYRCHAPHEQRWFLARATRFGGDGPIHVVVAHENITDLKLTEEALRAAKEAAEAARTRAEVAARQKEDRRQEAERRRQVAENLRDVLATINSSWPLEDVLHFIVSQSRRLLGGQAAALYRRRGENGRLEIQVGDDLPLDDTMNQPLGQHDGKTATGEAALAQGADEASAAPGSPSGARDVPEPLIETVALEGTREPNALAVPVPQPFQSVLAIPVVGSDEDYGSLAIYRQDRQRFTREETNLAALFGDQAALAVENARLRDKAREAAVLAERDRIARDLHDAVTQAIFSASIIADSLPKVWERSPSEGKRGLDELRCLTHGALAEMRTLLLELRPTAILEKRLDDLIAQLGGALSSRTRVAFDIAVTEEGSLPPDVHAALYRIVQEAINNIAKHADARHIWVHGRIRTDRAALRVFDDGHGFDIGAVPRGQLGISIMHERARSIGARLRVHSRPGRGTMVAVMWDETDETEGRQSNA